VSASLDKTKAIRCLLDVIGGQRSKENPKEFIDRIPKEMFGTGRARVNRKMVLIAIAASSDPNGDGAWPSLDTLKRRTLLNEKTVRRTIQWLVAHGLLEVKQYAGPAHTNRYRIIFGNLDSRCPSDGAGNMDTSCPCPSAADVASLVAATGLTPG
jgi:helix-turn-helix protein